MIAKLCQALNIDYIQLKTLIKNHLRIDLRQHKGIGRNTTTKIPPLIYSGIFYFFMSLMVSISLLQYANIFLFEFVIFSYAMVMSLFTILLEFGNTIITPEDNGILGFRPINSRTYFTSKLINLFIFNTFLTFALGLIPAIFGIFIQGGDWSFPIVFFPFLLLATTVSAAIVVLIYTGLLKILSYKKFKDILAGIQIIFVFVIFFSYQFVPRMVNKHSFSSVELDNSWLNLAPPIWFSGAVEFIRGDVTGRNSLFLIATLVFSVILAVFAFRKISIEYTQNISSLQEHSGQDQSKNRKESQRETNLLFSIFKSEELSAGFKLTTSMMKRSRELKMTIYGMMGIPLAYLGILIYDNSIADPFTQATPESQFWPGIMNKLVLVFLSLMVTLIYHNMFFSKRWKAAWIFHSSPVEEPGKLLQGVKLAVVLKAFIPFTFLFCIIYGTQIPLSHAIQASAMFLIIGLVLLSGVSIFTKSFPFSKIKKPGSKTRRLLYFLIMPFFLLIFAPVLQFGFSNTNNYIITMLGLFALFLILESIAVKKTSKNLRLN